MLRTALLMEPLSLILVVAVVALVFVVLALRRVQQTLAAQLEAERAQTQQQSANHQRLLEEARSRAPVEHLELRVATEDQKDQKDPTNDLRDELARTKETAAEYERRIEEARRHALDLEKSLDASKRQTDATHEAFEREREVGQSLRERLEVAERQTITLGSEVEAQRKLSTQYLDELGQTAEKARRLDVEVSVSRQEVDAVRGELERLRAEFRAKVAEGDPKPQVSNQGTDTDVIAGAQITEGLENEARALQAKSETLAKELSDLRSKAETRIRELQGLVHRAEEDVATAQMQKDAFAGEVRALRDELERRKRLAEAEAKPATVQKARPSKPPEPIITYFCLVCGEGGGGPKPHRCLVEEQEQLKKAQAKR